MTKAEEKLEIENELVHDMMMAVAIKAKEFGFDHDTFIQVADASIDCVLTDWPNKPVPKPSVCTSV